MHPTLGFRSWVCLGIGLGMPLTIRSAEPVRTRGGRDYDENKANWYQYKLEPGQLLSGYTARLW